MVCAYAFLALVGQIGCNIPARNQLVLCLTPLSLFSATVALWKRVVGMVLALLLGHVCASQDGLGRHAPHPLALWGAVSLQRMDGLHDICVVAQCLCCMLSLEFLHICN